MHPLSGSPREIERLVGSWLSETDPAPLSVRTSGSTAGPKDVLLSAAAVRASVAATSTHLGGAGRWTLALPAHYVAGLQVISRCVLAGTSPVVLDEHVDLAAATAAMTQTPAPRGAERRYLALVPTQLHRYLDSDRASLAAYDCVLLGGAAVSARLLQEADAAGITVVTTYGMSETCGGCVYDGVPLDGVGVALSSAGDIRISGPVLFDGYADRPDLTHRALRDGWFHTADLGRFDDDGRLDVLGRRDDVVISGGVNISLSAVENRLLAMPGVEQAAVTSRPDAEWGAEVVAVVEDGPMVPDLDDIRDFVSAEHPRTWAPRFLLVVDALPLLTTGKVDRRRLAGLIRTAPS